MFFDTCHIIKPLKLAYIKHGNAAKKIPKLNNEKVKSKERQKDNYNNPAKD